MRVHTDTQQEAGAATVWCIGLTGLLLSAMLVATTVSALLIGHRRAAAGADLAALAGAEALQRGASGCAEAHRLTTENEVRLMSCRADGTVIEVVAAVEVSSPIGSTWLVRAQALAGPTS